MRTVTLCVLLVCLITSSAVAQPFDIRAAASQAPDLKFPASPKTLGLFSSLEMAIYKPDGAGPFPALVLVHTCGGLRPEIQDWTKNALSRGYVAFVIDSLGPRGVKSVCIPPSPVNIWRGAKDAFQALEHLQRFDFVDQSRIGLMGFSWGAMVGLLVNSRAVAEALSPSGRFASVASFYPACYFSTARGGVELVLEPARQHALDLGLPALLLEPRVIEELAGAGDVLLVELDAHVARELVRLGIRAREPDELGLRNGHALALEREVDRALLDDRVDVVAPRVVVDEDVDRKPLLLVEPARQAPDPAGRLSVSGQKHAVVPAPELVLGEPIPLRALLDQQDEVGGALPDLQGLRLDDRRHGVLALAEPRASHALAVVHQPHPVDDLTSHYYFLLQHVE